MFEIVIANGATFIHRSDNNMLMGFLINHEGIKEMIELFPVNKYYVEISKGNTEEITKEQAFMLYDLILEGHNNRNRKNNIQDDDIKKIQKK